jgi:hypothetical protein
MTRTSMTAITRLGPLERLGRLFNQDANKLLSALKQKLESGERSFKVKGPKHYVDEGEGCNWGLTVSRPGAEEDERDTVDIDIYLYSSDSYGDEDGQVAWACVMTYRTGLQVGDLIPQNWTEEFWIDRDKTSLIRLRWEQLVSHVEGASIPRFLAEWFDDNPRLAYQDPCR